MVWEAGRGKEMGQEEDRSSKWLVQVYICYISGLLTPQLSVCPPPPETLNEASLYRHSMQVSICTFHHTCTLYNMKQCLYVNGIFFYNMGPFGMNTFVVQTAMKINKYKCRLLHCKQFSTYVFPKKI